MKDMIYKSEREEELLDRGTYKDHEYFVISMGTHPCGYVKLNSENPKIAENVPCHGGVTYNRNYLMIPNEGKLDGKFIGWDYAHYGDYIGYDEPYTGMTYTTEEIVYECMRVIDDLIST